MMVASAQIFQTLLYEEKRCTEDEANQFCDQKEGYLYVYTMLFGEFEREDFDTTLSVIMFVVYTFIVVIVMLNVLIAIVGDSYDKSMLDATRLFGRARVLFVAELFAFERGLQSLMCCGDSWGKCFSASLLILALTLFIITIGLYGKGNEGILLVFFGVPIIVFAGWWLSNERSCGGRIDPFCPSALRGDTTARRWCICIIIATVAGLLRSFYAFYASFCFLFEDDAAYYGCGGHGVFIGYGFAGFFSSLLLMLPWIPHQPINRFLVLVQPIKSFLESILLRFFGLLLGRSASDEFSIGENNIWKNWTGRIHHMEKNVTDTVSGSEDRVKASFHKAVEDSENSVKASVDSLQASVVALENKLDVTLMEILLRLDKMEKSE
jgi:hypothetical protein